MSHEIKFGTDGWRGIIAQDFTFDMAIAIIRVMQRFKP